MRAGWKTATLGEVCSLIARGIAPRYIDCGGTLVLNQKCIRDHSVNYAAGRRHESAAKRISTDRFIQVGDVLINSTGTGTLGRVAQVRNCHDEPATVDTHVTIVRPNPGEFYPDFFGYALVVLEDLVAASGEGASGQTELARSTVTKFEISYPTDLEVQQRIVAVLDEAFAAIATATANAQKNLANARELFEATVRDAFACPDELWRLLTLKEAARDFGRGKSKHRPRNDPKLYGGEYPFIQTGDVRNCDHLIVEYSQTYSATGLAQSKLWPKGTICITIAANIAETGILNFDACFPDSVIGMVVDPVRTSNSYVEYLLQSLKAVLQAKGKGSAQANINLATFENERFPFPPLDVQLEIVARLGTMSEQVQMMEAIYSDKLLTLTALKQSLLHRAFTGELTAERSAPAAIQTPIANDNDFTTPAFTANVIAFAYRRHAAQGTENTFGRVKAQKALHLCESLGGIDLGRRPIKDAAGPNDFQHMLAAENWARANQFFEFEPRPSGSGYTFKKLARFNEIAAEGMAKLKPVQAALERSIAPIVALKSEQAELLATVHAAWNNLILDGVEPSDAAIIYEARDNWHVDKLKFSDAKFHEAIRTIRAQGIVPDGSVKRVGGQERLL